MKNQSALKKPTTMRVSAAENMQQKLIRKASTVAEKMVDEFLSRQAVYEKLSNPILKMEAARIQAPAILPSKLRDAVHEARNRLVEIKKKRNSLEISKQEKRNSLNIYKPEKRDSISTKRNSLDSMLPKRKCSEISKPGIYFVPNAQQQNESNLLIYIIATISLLCLLIVIIFT